ncbi:glycosyltransferase [Candidatus Kaiserbacteria bacterium]|nr:glycosyltransferase [Candidatus Kaiserbacteria bacterium]
MKEKKKILIFSMAYHPFVGGAEVAIKEITDRISPRDIEFHMITLRYDSTLSPVERVGNVLIHRIGFTRHRPSISDLKRFPLHLNKAYYQCAAAVYALRLHKKYRYGAIWAIMAHSAGVPAAIFKTLKPHIPYGLTLQEGDSIGHIKKTMLPVYPLFLRAFRKADCLQVISTYLAKWGITMGFRGKPLVIPNGVDIQKFSKEYPRRELELLKQTLNKKTNTIFLITTSRLVKKNSIDTVIEALVHLPQRVHFLILGSGSEETALKRIAEERGVMNRVRFLGEVQQQDIPKYLKASDIFIRPSRSEGMGISFVEAMAAGVPVIATQEGGISDFLFDPENNSDVKPTGLAVHPEDSEGIAKQVFRYESDVVLRREITDNAKALVEARYDWKTIAPIMRKRFFDPLLTDSKKINA